MRSARYNCHNLDLIRSFIEVEGNLTIIGTLTSEKGVTFSGYKEKANVKFVLDKYEAELISECTTIEDIYEAYKEIGYFSNPT